MPFETLHDQSDEETLLAALLVGGSRALAYTANRVKPEDFWHENFGKLYRLMLEVHERENFNITALRHRIRDKGLSDEIAALDLSEMQQRYYAGASLKTMVSRVVTHAERRKLYEAAESIKGIACNPDEPEYMLKAGEVVAAVRRARADDQAMAAQDAFNEMEKLGAMLKRGVRPTVSTGIESLDQRMVMGAGDLIVVGARTSIGKSALLYQIALHVAETKPVLFVSCEMDKQGLTYRLVNRLTGIPVNRMRAATLSEAELSIATKAVSDYLKDRKLRQVVKPGASVRYVRDEAQALAADLGEPVGLICVDYLQLLQGSSPRMSPYERVSESSTRLKQLAMDLGVPVAAAAQLGRDVEKGEQSRRPGLVDLKDSGQIEQDADTVILIHRDRFTREAAQPCELSVQKHRGGELFDASVYFQPDRTLFIG